MGQIRKMALVALTLAISAISLSSAPVATAAIARISVVPGPNNSVTQITEPDSEGNRYLAGTFTAFDSWGTGGGAVVDNQTGTANTSFPKVTGEVLASAPDGSGGFYIGGTFTAVGDVPRNNLAHISSDGTLTNWDPNVNGVVARIAVSGSTVYLGGIFTTVGGTIRNNVAAVSTDGTLTNWDPNVNGVVGAIAVSGSTVYLGGAFTAIGGTTRNNVAAVSTDGTLTNWDPNVNGVVARIAVSGSTVYLGGDFNTVGGTIRNNVAAINTDGMLTNWDPDAHDIVRTIAVSGDTVYLGGDFNTIGTGASLKTRNRVAAVNITNGVATEWNPNVNSDVVAIAVSGSTVYLSGAFTTVGGTIRNNVAAINTDGMLTNWNPNANNPVGTIAISGDTVYLGGAFTAIGGIARNFVAAINTDGMLTTWNPNANAWVITIAMSGDTVYLGGAFTAIGGTTRNHVAAVNNTTGAATTWDPNANSNVGTIAVSGDTVYLGGYFSEIGTYPDQVPRNHVAAVNNTTGDATTWDPDVNNAVHAIAVSDGVVYLGGEFDTIGSGTPRETRNHVAAVNNTTGDATTWNPNADGIVRAIAVSGGIVYLGGNFTTIGTGESQATRNYVAAVSTDGTLIDWESNANDRVYTIAVSGETVYLGGAFTTIGGVIRNFGAAVNTNGTEVTWDPNANGSFNVIVVSGNTAYIGGSFTSIGGEPHNYIVAIDVRTGAVISLQLPPATPATPVATALDGKVTVSVNRGTAVAGTPSSFTVSAVQDETKTCTVTGTSGSCTIESLTNGISYTFVATARNTGGPSSVSVASVGVTPTSTTTTTAAPVVTSPPAEMTTTTVSTTTVPAMVQVAIKAVVTPKVKKGKTISFSTINKSAKISVPKGAKVVVTVVTTSKKICSVSKTTVKGLKAGTCTLSVAVTPKATAKVKKPRTVTKRTKVIVTK
jgi:hypothetical protein